MNIAISFKHIRPNNMKFNRQIEDDSKYKQGVEQKFGRGLNYLYKNDLLKKNMNWQLCQPASQFLEKPIGYYK